MGSECSESARFSVQYQKLGRFNIGNNTFAQCVGGSLSFYGVDPESNDTMYVQHQTGMDGQCRDAESNSIKMSCNFNTSNPVLDLDFTSNFEIPTSVAPNADSSYLVLYLMEDCDTLPIGFVVIALDTCLPGSNTTLSFDGKYIIN